MINRITEFAGPLLRGRLPSFVYGAHRLEGPPVFIYHRIDNADMEEHLVYLVSNGYGFLTAEETAEIACKGRKFNGREVCLTFDDGYMDLAESVEPLLTRYGAVGTAFISPGLLGRPGYLDWEALSGLATSGAICLGTHSFSHARIFISGEIDDYYRIGSEIVDDTLLLRNGADNLLSLDRRHGRPLYRASSRLGESPRYLEDERLTDLCVEYAARKEDCRKEVRQWKRGLTALCRAYRRKYGDLGRYESREDQCRAIMDELVRSRSLMEERLRVRIKTIGLPWNEGGSLVRALCLQAGYTSCYAGYIDGNRSNCAGADPFRMCRLSSDFVLSLPGKGRKSLGSILSMKLRRYI